MLRSLFHAFKSARSRGQFYSTAAIVLALTLRSFAGPPDIDSISPVAVRPGRPVEVTLSGTGLSGTGQLWTSFPAQVEPAGEGKYRITAAGPVGIGALRAYGSNGVSGLAFVVLDELPVVAEARTNGTMTQAQSLDLGSAVEGHVKELGYDWFQFPANKGQRLSVETVAARIGSKLDSVLRILNSAGRELAHDDDAPGCSGDSFLSFTAPETGTYFIELRDVNYGGGSSFFYHLRVGSFSPLPPAFTSAPDATPISEIEPNDTAAKAMKISLPALINGHFDKSGDRDIFEFKARKGQRLEFRAATRSLGSSCDAELELNSVNGKRLARSNPSASEEAPLTYSFPSNGTYRLTVGEITGAFGSNMTYRLSIQPASGFALTVDSDRVNIAPGKTFDLKITTTRTDYKGAVALGLEGQTGAFNLTNNIIAEGKSNVTMRVTVPEAIVQGTWQTFSVVGSAKSDGGAPRVYASTAPALRRQLPLLLLPPPELDGKIALGVMTK